MAVLCMLLCIIPSGAFPWKGKKKSEVAQNSVSKKKPGKYEKLFEKGPVQTVSGGFATLHRAGEKLYLEFPLSCLEREMLLASTVSRTSDSRLCAVGYKGADPLHLRFSLVDSLLAIRKINASIDRPDSEDPIDSAIVVGNFGDPIWMTCPILACTPDSSAVVFDATGLLVDCRNEALAPIPRRYGQIEVTPSFKKNLNAIVKMGSYENNISVTTRFSGRCSAKKSGVTCLANQPLTVEAQRTLLMLPVRKMKPRISDLRIGTFLTAKQHIPDGNPIESYTLANRWRLEPSDPEAYARGELTEPIDPIVFYLDTLFPESWKEPIREGVLSWNDAFEAIGFRDAVRVVDFPTDDSDFDPDNLNYSCIRYLPSEVENAMGPSWVDPVTGEIINATILIHHDVVRLVSGWRFVQTAQIDPRVRTSRVPEDLLMESLRVVATHEAGHCLGLMHNMAASSAFPVDSLRSVTFTSQYGTTPSVMDYARYNYIAQPDDQGVALAPPSLGVYDRYAIAWLYRYYPGDLSVEQEAEKGEKWIADHENDPMCRYGRQQVWSCYDPTALEEDLGDDAVKAGEYGIRNLKLIVEHFDEWLADDDRDFLCRKDMYGRMVDQFARYVRNAFACVGGVRLDDSQKAIDSGTRFVPVDPVIQDSALRWTIRTLQECEWLSNAVRKNEYPLGEYQTGLSGKVLLNLSKQFSTAAERVVLSSYLAAGDTYSVDDYFEGLYEEIWGKVVGIRETTDVDRILQRQMLRMLNVKTTALGGNSLFDYSPSGEMSAQCGSSVFNAVPDPFSLGKGYGWQKQLDVNVFGLLEPAYYKTIVRIEKLLAQRLSRMNADEKKYYEALHFALEQMLGKNYVK